jgi:hypothetical protein
MFPLERGAGDGFLAGIAILLQWIYKWHLHPRLMGLLAAVSLDLH